jgi:hypothetical protein
LFDNPLFDPACPLYLIYNQGDKCYDLEQKSLFTLTIKSGIEPVIELFLACPKTTITMFDIISFPNDFENVELATKVFEFYYKKNKKPDFELLMLSNYNSQLAGSPAVYRLISKPFNIVSFELIKLIIEKDENQRFTHHDEYRNMVEYCLMQSKFVYAVFFYDDNFKIKYKKYTYSAERSERIIYALYDKILSFDSKICDLISNVKKHSIRTDRLQEGLPLVNIIDETKVKNALIYTTCKSINELYSCYKIFFMKMLTTEQFYPNVLNFEKTRVQMLLCVIINVISNFKILMDEIELRYKNTTTLKRDALYPLEQFLIRSFLECKPNIFINKTIDEMAELQTKIENCPRFSLVFKETIAESECKCCKGKGKIRMSEYIDSKKNENDNDSIDDNNNTNSAKKRKTTE